MQNPASGKNLASFILKQLQPYYMSSCWHCFLAGNMPKHKHYDRYKGWDPRYSSAGRSFHHGQHDGEQTRNTQYQCGFVRDYRNVHNYPMVQRSNLQNYSRMLSFILRHGAQRMDLPITSDGFVYVESLLRLHRFEGLSYADIYYIVTNDSKQRFALRTIQGQLQIRANQGHSISVDNLELREVKSHHDILCAVHGTTLQAWYGGISQQGLRKMNRQYIHFANGELGDNTVISGMRNSSEVLIYIDIKKALEDGYKFFLSANGVVLCPGDESGLLPNCYFAKVVVKRTGQELPYEKLSLPSRSYRNRSAKPTSNNEDGPRKRQKAKQHKRY